MTQSDPSPSPSPAPAPPAQQSPGRVFNIAFWSTIAVLALLSLGLVGWVALRGHSAPEPGGPEGGEPVVYRPAPTELERILREAGNSALETVTPAIKAALDEAFKAVHQAVPAYAGFHYSVLGEYTELVGAVFGQMETELNNRLFGGIGDRLNAAAARIDTAYVAAFATELERQTGAMLAATPEADVLDRATQAVLASMAQRMRVTAPLAGVAAMTGGAAAIKVITSAMAKKVATTVAAKAAAKGVVKTLTISGGAGTGATIGLSLGPVGALVGGVIGAAGAWLLADAVVVNIDEYFNRGEFEQYLHDMIDAERDRMVADWTAELSARPAALMRDQSLKDLFPPPGT